MIVNNKIRTSRLPTLQWLRQQLTSLLRFGAIPFISIYFLTIPLSSAQIPEDLNYLVFEPVLIDILPTDDQSLTHQAVSLATDDEPVTISEYIINQMLPDNLPADEIPETSIAAYEESIQTLELQGGAYEPALSQELFAIASLYQSQNDHITALEYLDQALHVNRVNSGLFNLDQEQIIEGKIRSHLALGELMEADAQQQYLFFLKSKAYGVTSVELLPALDRYAEWNIFAFDSRFSFSQQLNSYSRSPLQDSTIEEGFRTTKLANAQVIYQTMLNILAANFGNTDLRLLDIEKKLVLTNYFFATNLGMGSAAISNGSFSNQSLNSSQEFYNMSRVSSNSLGFRHGREALERRLNLLMRLETVSPEEIARARVDLADWLLIFRKRSTAFEIYQQAYDELIAQGGDSGTINELFSPEIPIRLPTFINNRYSRAFYNIPEDLALKYQGWLDVEIQLNRYGQPQNMDIIGQNTDESEPSKVIEARLNRLLRNSTTFRPRFSEGKILQKETLIARYYYSY